MQLINKDMVYVCPSRDIECGNNVNAWCDTCPKRELGPAAQPEGEAAPDALMDAVAAQSEWVKWRQDHKTASMTEAIFAWHQSKMAEAKKEADVYFHRMNAHKGREAEATERAEKAEAALLTQQEATDRALNEMNIWLQRADAAESALAAQPAPQAGDALGSIDTPAFKDLWEDRLANYSEAVRYINYQFDKASCKAHDKGQVEARTALTDQKIYEWAEGYQFSYKGNPHKMTFSRGRFIEAVRTILAVSTTSVAAPPASAAQQEARPMPTSPREALHEVSTAYFMSTECERAEAVVGMIEKAMGTQQD